MTSIEIISLTLGCLSVLLVLFFELILPCIYDSCSFRYIKKDKNLFRLFQEIEDSTKSDKWEKGKWVKIIENQFDIFYKMTMKTTRLQDLSILKSRIEISIRNENIHSLKEDILFIEKNA